MTSTRNTVGSKRGTRAAQTAGVPVRRARKDLAHPAASLPDVFPIVGIGASAGGLEASTDLFKHLPAHTGMAFVLIQHMEPSHESRLAELLSRAAHIPVTEVKKDGLPVEPDHVYIIPPNKEMAILNRRLRLLPRSKARGLRLPIDHFFESLASQEKSRAIGVILSGTASDGTLGLKAIKAEGGITFAQDPKSAKFDGMPRSAVAAGCVDFILPAAEIAREIARMGRHPYVARSPVVKDESLLPGDPLHNVIQLLRKAKGADFTHYKRSTISRRIERRMALKRIEELPDYIKHLQETPAEVEALFQDILIHVTAFFRDPAVFNAVKKEVFPAVLRRLAPGTPVRIWVPGCSTGEEVYSLAICLTEVLEKKAANVPIQIFGTDISDGAIASGRAGIYPKASIANLSPQRLKRFFDKVDDSYQVKKSLREKCVFARQDVTQDPPFSRLDLISCRNLLIFLGPVLHKKVLPMFQYALKPTGFLLLGASETPGESSGLFNPVNPKCKIYSPKPAPRGLAWTRDPVFRDSTGVAGLPSVFEGAAGATGPAALQREADRVTLAKYAPVGVVIDEQMKVLQFRGRTSRYLEPQVGDPSPNLLRMAREGLLHGLRAAINEARKLGTPVKAEGLRVKENGEKGGFRKVTVEVIPIRSPSAGRSFLVFFEEPRTAARTPSTRARLPRAAKGPARKLQAPTEAEELTRLNHELTATREYLQSVIQEHETTNDELQSAHEEILSADEELQSTNEELETAKEELQSTNEELITLNEGLQSRNLELGHLNADLGNLLASVNIPILMAGPDLRLRRFSPPAGQLFGLRTADLGRTLDELRPQLGGWDLVGPIRKVMDTGSSLEEEAQLDNRWYSIRLLPYKEHDGRQHGYGVVAACVDVSLAKKAERLLQAAHDKLGMEVAESSIDLAAANESLRASVGRRELAEKSLRELSRRLLDLQDQERRRIARELHDTTAQRLTAVALNLALVNTAASGLNAKARGVLAESMVMIDVSLSELRTLAYLLHPPSLDEAGLESALRWYVSGFAQRSEIPCTLDVPSQIGRFSQELETTLFRIVQEALTNIHRHSKSPTAAVRVTLDPAEITLEVADQGQGMPAGLLDGAESEGALLGVGIRGMRERVSQLGGRLEISSGPGGTTVKAVLPRSTVAKPGPSHNPLRLGASS